MVKFNSQRLLTAILRKFNSLRQASFELKISPPCVRHAVQGKPCTLSIGRKIIEAFELVEGTDYQFALFEGKKNSVHSH